MTAAIVEDMVEQAAIAWLQEIGYTYLHGPDIAPGQRAAERATYRDVVLVDRLHNALVRLNPALPAVAIDEALRQITRTESPSLAANNHRLHKLLIEGVPVAYQDAGRTVYTNARVVDFAPATCRANNDWLAVNQFSILRLGVAENAAAQLEGTRRPDIMLFVNGLPLVVIELKNPADPKANVESAYKQLQTYKQEIPDLMVYNTMLVVADGTDARLGTLTAGFEWFKRWRSIDGEGLEGGRSRLEILLRGVFDPIRFLDLLRHFTFYEVNGAQIIKKIAQYHQYFAANKAVEETLRAVGAGGNNGSGNRKAGVIWHTQGSGKSLTMLFYAGKVILHPAMQNPTLVVLTDRNDLDDQLLENTFAPGHELLRQNPVQATSRADLREKLNVAAGGVIFTTIQKFMPDAGAIANEAISPRSNIIFIVDEAHRTQYGFEARYIRSGDGMRQVYGLAKYMRDALPNATFIGFTGTPVSASDRNTRNVFGEYIDVYDIQRAVSDQATVPIYLEARYAKMQMDEQMIPRIDPEFEEVTEGEEEESKAVLQSKWAQIEAIVGDQDRINLIAQDMVNHFTAREEALPGKAMIVAMSREIAVRLHDAIVALRPDWYHPADDQGAIKVVMTGAATDGDKWQEHIRTKPRRKRLADRFRDAGTDFKLVIVRDMWLTGFDAPSLHTMYVDKPMRGHNLMQAIARVNRVYPGKDGGLIVAYLPIQTQLQEALQDYTENDQELAGRLQEEAAIVMLEKYEVVRALFHGFAYRRFFTGGPTDKLTILSQAVDFILEGRDDRRNRYIDAVTALSRAYALATPHAEALAIRDEVAFFQAVKGPLMKEQSSGVTRTGRTTQELDWAVQRIVDRAVAPDGIVDLFQLAGLERPNISILSDEFLVEVAALPRQNIAVELLRRLIEDEIRARRRTNLVQAGSFADKLSDAVDRYNKQAVSAMRVINELIAIAKEMQAANQRGEELGLSEEELAFYDALAQNQSAVEVMGDEQLAYLARELLQTIRRNATIDWSVQESARAKMRITVKRLLRQYGYPPDLQEGATKTVVQQAEWLAGDGG